MRRQLGRCGESFNLTYDAALSKLKARDESNPTTYLQKHLEFQRGKGHDYNLLQHFGRRGRRAATSPCRGLSAGNTDHPQVRLTPASNTPPPTLLRWASVGTAWLRFGAQSASMTLLSKCHSGPVNSWPKYSFNRVAMSRRRAARKSL